MSSTNSYRFSGVVLILGCLLSAIYYFTQAVFLSDTDLKTLVSPLSLNSSIIGLCGSMLVLLGLPGVYVRQAPRAGILGLLGVLCLWYITLFQGVLIPFTTIMIIPALAANTVPLAFATTPPPTWDIFGLVSLAAQVLGILLLGLGTLRAGVFPRWTAWLLIATWVLGLVSHLPFVPDALSGLPAILGLVAMAGLGYTLIWPEQSARRQPAPANVEAGARA